MAWLADPHVWASFVTLAALEVVLGVDNLVFVALLSSRLPGAQQAHARRLGLALALGTRLVLLWSIVWLVHLTHPIFSLAGHDVSWRDLILIGGGAFLLYKGTREIHLRVDSTGEGEEGARHGATFIGTVVQIATLDVVFSLDSVITAVGIANEIWVMVAAIVVAMAVMLAASNPLAAFIERHASVKMLALSFLLLIGWCWSQTGPASMCRVATSMPLWAFRSWWRASICWRPGGAKQNAAGRGPRNTMARAGRVGRTG